MSHNDIYALIFFSMRTKRFCLNVNYIRNRIAAFFDEHAALVAIVCCSFLTGLLIGIVVAVRFGEEYYKLNLFAELKSQEYGKFSTFFTYFLLAFATLAINFTCVFKKYFTALGFVWTAFLGYRFGLGFVGAANVALTDGILTAVFFYLPLCIGFVTICFVSIGAASKYWIAKGATLTCARSMTELLSFYVALLLCFTLLALVVCVIMPWLVALVFF